MNDLQLMNALTTLEPMHSASYGVKWYLMDWIIGCYTGTSYLAGKNWFIIDLLDESEDYGTADEIYSKYLFQYFNPLAQVVFKSLRGNKA